MPNRTLLLPLVAVSLFSTHGPASAQGAADVVSLRFAWPVGLAAEVDQEWIRRTGDPAATLHIRSLGRLETAADTGGIVVRQWAVGTPEVVAPAGGEGDAPLVTALAARLSAIRPSFVVSPAGDFVRLVEVERLQERIHELLQSAQASVDGGAGDVIALLRTLVSPEAVTAGAEQEWSMLVAAWVDADLEVGALYEAEAEDAHPLIPSVAMPVYVEFAVERRVPCIDGERELRCVELVMESEADADALRRAVMEVLRQAAPGDVDDIDRGLRHVGMTETVRVIAEPGTLVPHRLETVKVVHVTADATGPAAGFARHQEDRRVVRFRYD